MTVSHLGYLTFKFIINLLIPLTGFLWLAVNMRLLSSLLIWIPVLLHRPLFVRRKIILLIFFWALQFASTVAPFDITFANYPGPPRFVLYIIGLPTAEGQVLMSRYEALWGGCLKYGNEPTWVWIWQALLGNLSGMYNVRRTTAWSTTNEGRALPSFAAHAGRYPFTFTFNQHLLRFVNFEQLQVSLRTKGCFLQGERQ